MSYARKVDANQPEIVSAFRRLGCSVAHCHTVGDGFPDIAVGLNGLTYLVEIKDGAKAPSARKLTKPEQEFHEAWQGHICIVNSVDDVLALVAHWRAK